ncbi:MULTISPECIES: ShlB/FhaC/HecB family hemolysin secretion/activation protein [unclassified Caballeronia]|uniref:ShlB/FhaC/HecB family hemolysin secretion/activation protein n=1 Tax=unclassified Caballeronia TaxID=2646786 RepID=UPI00285A513A|nr:MULTISPECIES: ShlB/FhaC/HecB family hemolysin secretion/activation protein [unclassified Caballeronia]MDR5775656.1 ShlB/FhaC/HecB family hemolysin secretion/activation protein [Caballeronia sp. LZ002]MDR5851094.1 ShlB/FhaC/HecB family hemolysin secretion/activation protein [Caballeronia sp. LZ003]
MRIRKWLTALPLTAFASLGIHAQQAPNSANEAAAARANAQQEQQVQQQREAQQRDDAVQAPAVRSAVPGAQDFSTLPTESPCFRINTFTLDVPPSLPDAIRAKGASALPLDPFAFAREWLGHYTYQCIGKEGVNLLTKGLQQAILSRGYITTRVLLPEQDLSHGTLKFALVPGVIRDIRFAEPLSRGSWKTAFPTRPGDVLDLRDLEQGIEQMKRVASQDADMKIEPTDIPGESDVVLTVKRGKPYSFVASVDNSGSRATGKLQGNLSLGIDNLLGLNDVLTVGANQDLEFGDKGLGSHGFNGSYSMPWGYWTATVFGNTNTYYQQIAGANQTFVSSGNSQTAGVKLARVLHRGQSDVFGTYVQLSKRFGASFIDDTEIELQHRNNTFLELGLTDRHYLGGAQFDGTLAFRQGIGAFGATPDPSLPPDPNIAPTPATKPSGPTYRFHMAVLDANLSVPFAIANQALRYVTTIHGQYTNDTLNYIDDLTIGSRYTVRGFDGEQMLAAERGFYWRNELQAPIGKTGQALYAGIDYGRVFGPNTAFLAGTQLVGAVIGIRGGVPTKYAGLSYDLFAGTPIYKPSGFPTSRVTVGFQMTAQL